MPRLTTPATPFADEVIQGLTSATVGFFEPSTVLASGWELGPRWEEADSGHRSFFRRSTWVLFSGDRFEGPEHQVSLPDFVAQLTQVLD